MSKSNEYTYFRMKREVPAHKLRDDLRDREARTECSDAKKYVPNPDN